MFTWGIVTVYMLGTKVTNTSRIVLYYIVFVCLFGFTGSESAVSSAGRWRRPLWRGASVRLCGRAPPSSWRSAIWPSALRPACPSPRWSCRSRWQSTWRASASAWLAWPASQGRAAGGQLEIEVEVRLLEVRRVPAPLWLLLACDHAGREGLPGGALQPVLDTQDVAGIVLEQPVKKIKKK